MKKAIVVTIVVAACAALVVPTVAFGASSALVFEHAEKQVAFQLTEPTLADEQSDSAGAWQAVHPKIGQKVADAAEAIATAVQASDKTAAQAVADEPAVTSAVPSVGFVDENGNGLCDRYEQGACAIADCPGHGSGSGYGYSQGGSGYGYGHHGNGHRGGHCW